MEKTGENGSVESKDPQARAKECESSGEQTKWLVDEREAEFKKVNTKSLRLKEIGTKENERQLIESAH
jgi:hypothetical protein